MASERDTYFEQQAFAYENICNLLDLDHKEHHDNIDLLNALTKTLASNRKRYYDCGYTNGYHDGQDDARTTY